MNKIIQYTWPLALSGLLLSQISFAGHPSKQGLAELCSQEVQQLNRLIEHDPLNKCNGDILTAAMYLKTAETKIQQEHFDEAQVSLHYSEAELKEIANSRAYCAAIAPKVKPSLAKVMRTNSELETWRVRTNRSD
ncbi:hypothetical protein ACD661_15625 [Legionella lytica]|uniref:Secreted endonuclease n=1 Tax=Legionella lytica TaxID=96232 RepID=A0ABW8DB93_9GAMM